MNRVLSIIVIAQFFCTSLWFAGNAIMPDLIVQLHLTQGFLANLISAVQFGFISGTLVFALLTIADRFSPSKVFFVSAIIAALFNLAVAANGINSTGLLFLRFLTGFFLAGIYPVGMKIASDYYQKGLGKSLGFLVGALVLGTAFPHLLKSLTAEFSWKYVVFTTSLLSFSGGLMMLIFVKDGPYRKAAQTLKINGILQIFKNHNFRSAAFGYFGHMWELYAFWAFVPLMLKAYKAHYQNINLNVPLYSFLIIASGGIACAISGILSQKFRPKNIALISLSLSGLCCLLSPLFLFAGSATILIAFLFFWGLFVVADSPLLSTMVAQNTPEASRGTALTLVNCIGFAITIISIQFINGLSTLINAQYIYLFLAIGPILGTLTLARMVTKKS
jgi:MFS family permease